ncbi:putative WD-repeat protein [Trichophaea hybrida]|nr:putative WD-repeat protein [Trichophaea hybrida]
MSHFEQDQHLSKLPCADGAAFNSRLWEHKAGCLNGTRVDLLHQIMTWSESASGAGIYWLNGMAGTGKSTIARTVARDCHDKKRLGASFFFSRGQGDLGHATKFFTSLATQLANTLSVLKPYICRAIAENPDISERGLAEQWKHLIFLPLSNVKDVSLQSRQYILMIDALDECEGEKDIGLILQLLAEAKTLNTVQLKVFVTSRPETPIRHGFNTIPEAHQDFILHHIPQHIIQSDISIFLRHELEDIRRANFFSEEWPGESIIELLCQRARGLFIYASTACRFIGDPDWHPDESLVIILKDDYVGQTATGELDDMYTKILMHAITSGARDQQKLSSQFRQVVGAIVTMLDTLPATILDRLLLLREGTVHARLRCLHSILDIPKSQGSPIRLLHPSFRDFLLDEQRCKDPQFYIDQGKAHTHLFVSCLNLMSKHLKRDMCNLQLPGTLTSKVGDGEVENVIPLDVQYACRHWVYHVQQSNIQLHENNQVHIFLQKHFLHWLEALSLIGKLNEGVLALKTLESILMSGANNDLLGLVNDAKRFVLNARSIIEIAPLQIYCSALVFSPWRSRIRRQFWDQTPLWIKNTPVVPADWNPSLQSLEGHSNVVIAVAFSPDSQLLASASSDNTVRLWDLSTGASRGTLEGHSGSVYVVAFSSDSQLLASASDDNTVRLWDPSTGASRGTLMGHSDSVRAVTFSSDSQLLASASGDNTVRLWDSSTGASRGTLEGHSDWVRAVAFSSDSQLLASSSDDNTVRLWDPSTGASRGTLKGHSDSVRAVAFSSDSQFLASASDDNTVRLWDLSTGASRGTLEGHSDWVRAVAFSLDSQLLASASDDNTVRLWDPSTGALRSTLKGHSGSVRAVVFSSDSQLLASASFDNTVRLWDSSTGASRGNLEGHSAWVRALAFSSDSQLLASASSDNTVRLWDPSTGVSRDTLEGHSDSVRAVAFSSDSQLLASASDDNTVRLWDPSTGVSHDTLEGHSGSVRAVTFSSDNQLLASASNDNTVRLWDPSTGALCGNLEGHSDWVRAVAFSSDSQLLASASDDNTVRLWDPSTGASRSTLEGHLGSVRAVAFSPDSQLLASASDDNTVRLWDPSTGASRGTLEGHSGSVRAVTFSSDSQLLASASSDNTIRLWDIQSKKEIQKLVTEEPSYNLSFSSNGDYLETDRGTIVLNHLPHRNERSQSNQLYSLYVCGSWVTVMTENILWLPPDYRSRYMAVRNNVLAIGTSLGRVIFIEIDSDTVPLGGLFRIPLTVEDLIRLQH